VRLTLRTLLAYLDDTLEPAQAKLIGQKVAESDTAQELIARIKAVTRRRRVTAPPATGAKVDANLIAGYLDNLLSAEQQAEVEQTCLASDLHLAEMAACHQILTLVLGEPALVPPTAKQRMYGLVRGPEAIPFRKPAQTHEREEIVHEQKETDETLRLGLPALRAKGGWSNALILVGGGLAVAALLVIAIIHILHFEGNQTRDRARATAAEQPMVAQAKPGQPSVKGPDKATPIMAPTTAPQKTNGQTPAEKGGAADSNGKKPKVQPSPEQGSSTGDVPPGPPSKVRTEIGQYRNPTESVVLQYDPDKRQWQRLDMKRPRVFTGSPLVSLPGYKSVVSLKNGLRLTLWGNIPEFWPSPPVLESLVELHQHDQLDADLTLRRGRIVLTATGAGRPPRVRVRFENPTNPTLQEMWDLTLEERDTEVSLERWGLFPPGEPFFKDPADKKRVGPRADLALVVLKGHLTAKVDDLTVALEAPPKRSLLLWNSFSGSAPASALPTVPEWSVSPLPFPKGMEKVMLQPRAEFRRATETLSTALSGKLDKVDVGLANALKSMDPSERILVVRCFAAIDDLDALLDYALTDDKHHEVRQNAIGTLRYWIGCSRDNDYKLYEALKTRYKAAEPESILGLLHGFSPKALTKRETYETLIDYLIHPNLVIRELSYLYLVQLVPAGRKIAYTPVADSRERQHGQKEWLKLLDAGQIPPRPMGK
jgi:hypothetical protein